MLINVPHTQLTRHPRNMRLSYPLAKVRRMGLSQLARVRRDLEPCIQPLIITIGVGKRYDPAQHPHAKFIIVAGHLRHAGNAWLGKDSPPLNCIIRNYADNDSMLAEMRTENGMRADISPLGWARHFQDSLQEDPQLTVNQLARESGKSVHFVNTRLALLQLTPLAQSLIEQGDLPLGAGLHLLRLTDQKLQAKTAKALANRKASQKTIEKHIRLLLDAQPDRKSATRRPAVDGQPTHHSANLADVRASAATACAQCDIGKTLPLAEPAWHIALKIAGETCACCGLQTIKNACNGCPLAETMTAIVRATRPATQPAWSHA